MQNVVGKPVQGANFFGREQELAHLRSTTEDAHVLLLAPRRVGKTSLLFALKAACDQDESCTAVYASVASARSERDFVQMLLEAVYATPAGKKLRPNRIGAWFRRGGRRVKKVELLGSGIELEPADAAWQDDADRALRPLAAAKQPWLFLIDELPTLVLRLARADDSGDRVRSFLLWFRNLRQLPTGADRLRFVLAGSIGLDNVTRRYRLTDTINDLEDWDLGPYDEATADDFLIALGRSYRLDLTPELRQHIRAQAEWLIPFHLQVIFGALRKSTRGAAPTAAMLDVAIERLLSRKVYFSYWDERLLDALGNPDADHARRVLGACAADVRGASEPSLQRALRPVVADDGARTRTLSWILDVLSNDGYLVRVERRWRFRSGLLRRYWEAHQT